MAKQRTPSVGHEGKHPCKGSFYQERRLNIEKIGVGGHIVILKHPECNCNTGCRRVALYHPRPADIEILDDWTVKAIARIRFGDGCGGPEVEVDWKHGVILDLMGCYDEVSFEIIEILGTAPDEDNPYVVGVLSACCGAGAARGCATRTTGLITIGTGGTQVIPIPPFAYALAFIPTESSSFFSTDVAVAFAGSGTGAIISGFLGNDMPDPIMIPAGAESVIVVNAAAEQSFEASFLIGV